MREIARAFLISVLLFAGCRESATTFAPPAPVAEFTVSPIAGPAPLVVTCINLTQPADASMNWQFGDGTITNDVNPVHTFDTPGIYDIVLIAINESGSSEMVYTSIVVTGPPPPPTGPFPAGPDELQYFTFSGNNETVMYQEGTATEFDVSVYVEEDGIPGTPSQIGGWAVSVQWSLDNDLAMGIDVVWSDFIMSINGGDGPDLVIGGLLADHDEINMGCVANVSWPIDWWYLPPSEPMEIVRMTWATVPGATGGQAATIDFHIGASIATPNRNTVSVRMPDGMISSAHTTNGHLAMSDWQITVQPQP